MRKALGGAFALAAAAATLVLPGAGIAGKTTARPATKIDDVQHVGTAVRDGVLPLSANENGLRAMKSSKPIFRPMEDG